MDEQENNQNDVTDDQPSRPTIQQSPAAESASNTADNDVDDEGIALSVAQATTDNANEDAEIDTDVVEDIDDETTAVAETTPPVEFDPLDALTSLLVGGVVQGSSELLDRLQRYEQEIRDEEEEEGEDGAQVISETDIEWLRYTIIGFIFEQQGFFRRGVTMAARLANQSSTVAAKAASPIVNSRYVNPIQKRYDQLVQRGSESVTRWTQLGRIKEPEGRALASKTYLEIVDEFIEKLADNEELQDLVTQQGLSLAAEVRDEVRERTVTGDNVLEGVVRRILRRTPREELPVPPEEVQKWAEFTFEDRKKLD